MYLCNALVRDIVSHNNYNRLRLINCGVKAFTRQESGQNGDRLFRFIDDGIEAVLPYVDPGSILKAGLPELKKMLETYYPLIETFGETFKTQIHGKGGL